jgi:hypothetical protein
MICPECHAEYLDHMIDCGDCKVTLVDACAVDLPVPEMTWSALPPFSGKIYADMAAEILDKNDIPYYLKTNWSSSAFAIEAASLPGDVVRIFVPEASFEKASQFVGSITEKN